jgi:hypothetical protein
MNDRQRLESIVAIVCKYLPPDGISREEAMSQIIELVDPLPEQAEKESTLQEMSDIGQEIEWDTSDMAHRSGKLSVEQEPVAWMVLTQDNKKLMLYGEEKPPIFNTPVKLIPLYIAPSKREWVRLTDEEIEGIAKRLVADASYCSLHFAVAIQGAFMRKNT